MDANLSGADLSDAKLNSANFSYVSLYNVDLSDAKLNSANFSHANLFDANLYGANLFNLLLIAIGSFDNLILDENSRFYDSLTNNSEFVDYITRNSTCHNISGNPVENKQVLRRRLRKYFSGEFANLILEPEIGNIWSISSFEPRGVTKYTSDGKPLP